MNSSLRLAWRNGQISPAGVVWKTTCSLITHKLPASAVHGMWEDIISMSAPPIIAVFVCIMTVRQGAWRIGQVPGF